MTNHDDMPVMTTGPGSGFWSLNLLIIAGGCYLVGAQRLRGRGDRWPVTRSLAAAGSLLCLVAAVFLAPGAGMNFPAHVVQHLLLAMLGPLLLAMSAPITLALRALPRNGRRFLLRIVHSSPIGVLTLGPVVLILNLGGMYGYYLTPLYEVAHEQEWLQGLVHLHMFTAGCLLSWYLIGLDPMIRRPAIGTALIVLLTAAAGHDILAKLLYAHQLHAGAGRVDHIQLGAQIMFYTGNIIELVLATILMGTWYARGGREISRQSRRAQNVTI